MEYLMITSDPICPIHVYNPCTCPKMNWGTAVVHGAVPPEQSQEVVNISGAVVNLHMPGMAGQLDAIAKALEKISNLLEGRTGLPEGRPDKVLQGWKEIADFLGMSVSRAKRLGSSGRRDRMPVYSFHGRVYAKPTALDRWRTDSSVAVGVS